MRRVFISFLSLFVFFMAAPSMAAQDCDKVRSSADVMDCLNRNDTALQKELNKAFDKLTLQNSDEALVNIKDVQTHWLEYRDQECAAETADLETETLKRLESLRCMNRITGERIAAIQNTIRNEDVPEVMGEAAAQPRWMNALASDHPDIFWRYGERSEADLDCDGEPEHVMSGVQIASDTSAVKPVVSISENPVTGRPESVVVVLEPPAMEEGEAPESCGLLTKINYIVQAQEEPTEDGEEAKTCHNHLIVSAGPCGDMKVMWDGEVYGAAP